MRRCGSPALDGGGAVALCLMAAARRDKGTTACTVTSTAQDSQPREMFPRLVVFCCLPVKNSITEVVELRTSKV